MKFFPSFFGPPSRVSFAKALLAELKRLGDTRKLEFDEEKFRLYSKQDRSEINLHNVYTEHCNLPSSQRSPNLQRLAQVFMTAQQDLPENLEQIRSHLRPKIWNRSTMVNLALEARRKDRQTPDMPLYPLGSHLLSSLVYDTPNAMRSISKADLQNWGLSYYEAMEHACQNLEATTQAYACIGDTFHASMSGDNYDSSRILLIDRIQSFSVIGDHVAIVPQRDALFITGSEDEMGLVLLVELTKKSLEDNVRPLCPIPLRLVDGEWEDWEFPIHHPLYSEHRKLVIDFYAGLYADQKNLLEELAQEDEEMNFFIASYSIVQDETTDELFTYCVWGEGVDSLLPKTDRIALPTQEKTIFGGDWDHVRSIVGDLLQPAAEYYPPRFRVREFPSPAQLAEIGNFSP